MTFRESSIQGFSEDEALSSVLYIIKDGFVVYIPLYFYAPCVTRRQAVGRNGCVQNYDDSLLNYFFRSYVSVYELFV